MGEGERICSRFIRGKLIIYLFEVSFTSKIHNLASCLDLYLPIHTCVLSSSKPLLIKLLHVVCTVVPASNCTTQPLSYSPGWLTWNKMHLKCFWFLHVLGTLSEVIISGHINNIIFIQVHSAENQFWIC